MKYLKISLVGDGAVGKTALRERYIGGTFQSTYLMTIGADFASHKATINEIEAQMQIWDLAGQPRFESVRTLYYKGTMGVLVVYDVTRADTLENVPKWIDECFTHVGKAIPAVLLANKIDLREADPLALTTEQGENLATEMGSKYSISCQYLETSAKTGENVEKAFEILAREILTLRM
ncbi:MAG: GTP-binding protein [Candidatus Odinarchaeota archaeon]